MKYCKRCLQPDTRPGVKFNENQICYACIFEESKKEIDWELREAELRNIAEEAKIRAKEKGNIYDCVIGVSGGKDSTFQAIYARDRLGLNPLLVNCVPDEITDVGRYNMDNLSKLGFEVIGIRTDPFVARHLAKKGFYEYGNFIKASEYCLWSSAFIIADKFDISLIIQGENPALTLGTVKEQDNPEDAFSVINQNTLNGCRASDWIDDVVSEKKLYFYQFPPVDRLKKKGIKAIYLQYYTKEWSQAGNADFAIARGMHGRTTEDLHDIGRYRRYAALDTDIQIVNQMIKYLKFGFGYTTDEACYDIREGRISREEGLWLIHEYDGKCGEQYIQKACDYIGITKEEFWRVVDGFVNKKLFEKDQNGKWIPRFQVGVDFEET